MDHHKTSARLDSIGITASTLCAIHCAAMPLLFTSLPLLGLGFLANAWVEWGMIIFALIIGTYSIGLSYLRAHRRPLPLILLVGGFAIIMLGHAFIHGWPEAIVVPAGGLLIAVAHFVNYKCTGDCSLTASPQPSPKERERKSIFKTM
ncbi:MerC domain-containing protein [Mucilaginibacter pineti]|nr:MerC domain-containing protein [Mucilaginibacter pineti]